MKSSACTSFPCNRELLKNKLFQGILEEWPRDNL